MLHKNLRLQGLQMKISVVDAADLCSPENKLLHQRGAFNSFISTIDLWNTSLTISFCDVVSNPARLCPISIPSELIWSLNNLTYPIIFNLIVLSVNRVMGQVLFLIALTRSVIHLKFLFSDVILLLKIQVAILFR